MSDAELEILAKHTKALMPIVPKDSPAIIFRRLHAEVKVPSLAYEGSAAYDLYAFERLESGKGNRVVLPAHAASRPISTGICLKAPPGYVALVCSRSGLAARGIFVANAPGVVDPDYTGEIKVILYNGGYQSTVISHGDRVAQLLFVPFSVFPWVESVELPSTQRGDSGFGSSGA